MKKSISWTSLMLLAVLGAMSLTGCGGGADDAEANAASQPSGPPSEGSSPPIGQLK